jgi:hypothetical protein
MFACFEVEMLETLMKVGLSFAFTLLYMVKVGGEVLKEVLWRIEDRTDKCSNKLEVIEFRLENLQAEYKDYARHLCQCFHKYRAEGKNPEVLGSWISYLKESWTEGRLRVMRDASEEAWQLFVRVTLAEYKEVLEYEILQDPSCLEENTRVLKNLVIKASHV